ncbi:peptide-N4-(N-acetyl-beta- glucosaminyl)asparagine amidase [Entomortierella lignicola]|nr:peptide-N4-(N-acetyl-beta- glucosaminyl)asparagine amidase [Entomortierella lignicola]
MNPQEIQNLAQQLTSQFIELRQQRVIRQETANRPISQVAEDAVNHEIPSNNNNVEELASQLGGLMGQTSGEPPGAECQTAQDIYVSVPDPSIYEKEFTDTYLRVNESVLRYEDTQLLELACEQIPLDKLFEEAESMAKEYPDDSTDDIVIRRLLNWFKKDYFTWVNEPPCDSCQAKTTCTGHVAPTAQERQDGAGVVEVYKCTQSCNATTRFPRYGSVPKILFKTRRGRCGEWANVIERAEEVVDVTRRYTVDYDTTVLKRRRSIREPVLAKFLHRLSESNLARLKLDTAEIQSIRQRQALEADELSGKKGDNRVISTQDRESGKLNRLIIVEPF